MNQDEIDALAASMLRQKTEAEEKAAGERAALAAVAAQEAAEREERERPAREAAARADAQKNARINDVMSAGWGDKFVDADGTEHRKAAPAEGHTFETVGSTKDGQTVIGRYGSNRDNSALATWRKKD